MGAEREDHNDIPAAAAPKKRGWKNYQERARADGGVSRYINPTIGGKQRWVLIPEDPIYRGKKGYERFLAETLADAREKTTNARFAEAADEWLENYSRSKPGTLESYQRHVDLHLKPYFGATPLQSITSKDLTQFVSDKLAADLAIDYVKRMVWIFRAIYDPYVDAGILKRHPGKVKIRYRQTEVTGVELDEIEEDRRGGRALTVEEFQLLVNHSKGIYQLMFSLMLWTGLRVGETLAMQWRYLDLENLTYSVERNLNRHRELGTPKTEASRAKVSLSRFVGDWLERHRAEQAAERLRTPGWKDNDLIFASSGKFSPHPGAARGYPPVKEAIARAAARAGIGHVTPHDLRHTCATLLIQRQRRNIKEVSKHLRHKNPSITLAIYGHLYDDDLPAMAVAMDELLLASK
jgi:integrase